MSKLPRTIVRLNDSRREDAGSFVDVAHETVATGSDDCSEAF